MRKNLFIVILVCFLYSCHIENSYTVSEIIDGNSLELSNGTTVILEGIEKSDENIKILERYTRGIVHLYDKNNEEISKPASDKISAVVYNSDGDCINDLLKKVTQISEYIPSEKNEESISSKKTIISMRLESGVYTIQVYVNGILMYFIFDTGASLISISLQEVDMLYKQGKLTENDFVGKGQFTDANGDISEGTIINLKTIQIGDRILNDVLASVVDGQNSPLLFGQSALQKFGKVSIDYNRNEITFE